MNHPLPKKQKPATDDQRDGRAEDQAPTWLAQNYRREESDFAVDQYRRRQEPIATASSAEGDAYENYRQRMLERLREQDSGRINRSQMPPLPPRPTLPVEDIRSQDRHFGNTRLAGDRIPSEGRSGPSRFVVFAGIFAIAAGGGIGFAMTKYDQIAKSASDLALYVSSFAPAKTAAVAVVVPDKGTTISKKPISIATLKVEDVSGSLNTIIPLGLEADPAFATQELALKISGLPKSAYLSAGTKISDTTWLLKAGEENNINLIVPSSDTAKFDVSVAAIETKTGELAAPVKEMTVALDDASLQITPASAPPETATVKIEQPNVASAIPLPQEAKPVLTAEVSGLLEKGDSLLKAGDLIIARQFYSRAFQMGAAEGALGVAKTYDPAVFTQLNVQGLEPDASMATQWYEKAKLAGVTPPVASLP